MIRKEKKELFNNYVDLTNIADSMLLSSNTIIASYENPSTEVYLELRVQGIVDVYYKDEEYRDPADFPQELKDAIQKMPLFEIPDLYVSNNNWFELFVYDKEGEFVSSDVVDVENQTPDQIKKLMLETEKEILSEREKKVIKCAELALLALDSKDHYFIGIEADLLLDEIKYAAEECKNANHSVNEKTDKTDSLNELCRKCEEYVKKNMPEKEAYETDRYKKKYEAIYQFLDYRSVYAQTFERFAREEFDNFMEEKEDIER